MGKSASVTVQVTELPCTVDTDCPTGYECKSGICVLKPTLCVVNSDCPSGQVCSGGTCVDHAACPTGTHWDESQKACVADACTVDADCPTGQICQGGVCVTPPPPFNWIQIAVLAILGTAVVLVTAGATTAKD